MNPCIDTALNIGDTRLFPSGSVSSLLQMHSSVQLNVKVRGRQSCVKILKLGDSSLDGGV